MKQRKQRKYATPKYPRKLEPWSNRTVDKRGRSFNRQMQSAIYSVHKNFQREKRRGGPLAPLDEVRKRTALALGCSEKTVAHYVYVGDSGGIFDTPGKKRQRKSVKRDVDDSVKNAIREVIYEEAQQRHSLTAANLLELIRKNGIHFDGGIETFRKLLHDMEFDYVTRNGCKYIMEEPHILLKKIQFLRAYKKYLEDGTMDIISLDETWTYQKGTGKRKDWQDKDRRSCSIKTTSTGDRWIVVHAGGKDGFVPGASLFARSGKRSKVPSDYHADMNGLRFTKWLKEQLIPNLRRPSVIVMDNAPYHSVQVEKNPSGNWKKDEMTQWLQEEGINVDPKLTKKELYAICSMIKKPLRYELDEFVKTTTDHKILRLPPYYCIYNPIEMVWGLAKRHYDAHVGPNHNYSNEMTERVWAEALDSVTPSIWRNCCENTERRILEDYARDVADEEETNVRNEGPADQDDDAHLEAATSMQVMSEDESPTKESSFLRESVLSDDSSARRTLFPQFSSAEPLDEGIEDEDLAKPLQRAGDIFKSTFVSQSTVRMGGDRMDIVEDSQPPRTDELVVDGNVQLQQSSADQKLCLPTAQDWLNRKKDSVIYTEQGTLHVEDLQRLLPGEWLNDVLINLYLKLIVKRSGGLIYAYDSHFFPQLLKSYDNVKRWAKKADIFSKEMWLIPIHYDKEFHWTLCVVTPKTNRVTYYDSMGGEKQSCMDTILHHYIAPEMLNKIHKELVISEWDTRHAKDIPHQENFSDCGIFLCVYAEYLSRNASFDFSQDNIPQIRRRMMEEIISSQLAVPLLPLNPTEAVEKQIRPPPKRDRPLRTEVPVAQGAAEQKDLITGVRDVFLHQSASFHQGDRSRFPEERANAQCTGISTFWIAAMAYQTKSTSQDLLNRILLDGDRYYVACRLRNHVEGVHLHTEDLLTTFPVFDHQVTIAIYQCGEGDFANDNLVKNVNEVVNQCIEIYQGDWNRCGFLFIAHGKTVGFKLVKLGSELKRSHWFLFNPHGVDNNNRRPRSSRQSAARCFRCINTEALVGLLLADHPRANFWQIYNITVEPLD